MSRFFSSRFSHFFNDSMTRATVRPNNKANKSSGSKQKKSISSSPIIAGIRKMFKDGKHKQSVASSASTAHGPVSVVTDYFNDHHHDESQNSYSSTPELSNESSDDCVETTPTSAPSTPPSTAKHSAHLAGVEQHTLAISQPLLASGQPDNIAVALDRLRAATALLERRHAAVNVQESAEKKVNMTETTGKVATHTTPATVRLVGSQQQAPTANEAVEAFQRRQCMINVTYNAVYGCHEAANKLQQLNHHFSAIKNGSKSPSSDFVLGFGDIHIRASQLGKVEHNWIDRYNGFRLASRLHDRRIMSVDDYESITEHLFPAEGARLLSSEHFELFIQGLGEEGILTESQARAIASLGVTQEELERGAHFTLPTTNLRACAQDMNNVKIFAIPQRRRALYHSAHRAQPRDNLYQYLRILVESAVYNQHFYKGFFLPNAAQKLGDFHKAHELSEQGVLLPPHLTDYHRPWTHAETRLLKRGQLVCNMLQQYEDGTLTDFGIVRAVRATLVHIPGQPRHSAGSLETFLYSRLPSGSSLPVTHIPSILALLPDNDTAFASAAHRASIEARLQQTAARFDIEEAERLRDIEESRCAYDNAFKCELGVWGRIKRRTARVSHELSGVLRIRKAVAATPFDPFAAEHGNTVPDDKVDGSFYA